MREVEMRNAKCEKKKKGIRIKGRETWREREEREKKDKINTHSLFNMQAYRSYKRGLERS